MALPTSIAAFVVEAAGGRQWGQGLRGRRTPLIRPGPWGSGIPVQGTGGTPALLPGDCPGGCAVTNSPSSARAQFSSSPGCPCAGLPATGTLPGLLPASGARYELTGWGHPARCPGTSIRPLQFLIYYITLPELCPSSWHKPITQDQQTRCGF